MTAWIERMLARWLAAVAPPGWADSVLGDLREESGAGRAGILPLLRLVCRFGIERARQSLRELTDGPARGRLMMGFGLELRAA